MSVRREGRLKNAGAKLENGLKRGLIQAGMLVAQRAQKKAPRDTGRLKRSITRGKPYQAGSRRYAIDVGTNVEYARIQEEGGTIRPKTAGALSIPIGNLTGSPRQYALSLIKPKGGKPLLVDESGKAQYVLVSQVTIPAHPYLRPALEESRAEIRLILFKSVIGALKKK